MRCAFQDETGLYVLLGLLVGLIVGGCLGDRGAVAAVGRLIPHM
jgi:hypothetical protein